MSQSKLDPKTQAAWKQYQENLRKSQQYQEEKRRKEAQKNAPKPEPVPETAPQTQPKQPTQRFTEEQTKKILENLDIHSPPKTWTSTLTLQNITPFYFMINQFSQNLSKPIWQKFTSQPLKLNPYSLTSQQLIEKNHAIIETRKGTFLFNDLVTKLYFSSLPEDFRLKFKAHSDLNENIFNGFCGWSIFALVYIKINSKKQWSWVSRINHVWAKSLTLLVGSFFGMNKYFEWSDSRFARDNVEIVETCVDTHLRLLEAHGTDLDASLKKFINNEKTV